MHGYTTLGCMNLYILYMLLVGIQAMNKTHMSGQHFRWLKILGLEETWEIALSRVLSDMADWKAWKDAKSKRAERRI